MDCLFCKIIKGEVPAKIIYRDDVITAFDDINPQAPEHKVIVPQKHIATLNNLEAEDIEIAGHMMQGAAKLAKQLGIADDGYRLVMNCNMNGGQTVFHIHAHLLGGRRLSWPPG